MQQQRRGGFSPPASVTRVSVRGKPAGGENPRAGKTRPYAVAAVNFQTPSAHGAVGEYSRVARARAEFNQSLTRCGKTITPAVFAARDARGPQPGRSNENYFGSFWTCWPNY